MPRYAQRVAPFGTTVFAEMNTLASQHQAVNLGQGKPDFDGPSDIIEVVIDALKTGKGNQYPSGLGVLELRESIARHQARTYGITLDPQTQVVVTCGASEGMYASILGVVNEGDEVILLEPFFDTYLPAVLNAGGIPRYVPLQPPTWSLDRDALRAAFNERTGAIILNTPHNPTGRALSYEELAFIAELCLEHDVIVISDEVYEHLVYDGRAHVPMASLPNMFDRTLTVSSAAKTFSFTGWKVGWVTGHETLVTGVWRIHQNINYSINAPSQYGIAHALGYERAYYDSLHKLYDSKRKLLLEAIQASGLEAIAPEGAFYIMARFSHLFQGSSEDFARFLITDVGVATIPTGTFYCPEHRHIGQDYVRFAFCKHDDVITSAGERLLKLKGRV